MLETGSLTWDPFNERRITSSLGGQAFLDTLLLAVLPEQSLHLMDPGLGIIVVLALVLGLLIRVRAPPRAVVGGAAVPLLVLPPTANIASLAVATALFLTPFRTLAWGPGLPTVSPLRRSLPLALSAAAIAAVKNSAVPALLLVLVLWLLVGLVRAADRRSAALEWAATAAIGLVLVVPWLVSLHHSSGTYLYPLLGRGYHGTRYGTFYAPTRAVTASRVRDLVRHTLTSSLVIGLAIAAAGRLLRRPTARFVDLGLAFAVAAVAAAVVDPLVIGFAEDRFTYPFLFAAALAAVARSLGDAGRWTLTSTLVPVAAVGALVVGSWDETKAQYRAYLKALRDVPHARPLVSSAKRQRYELLQDAIPPHARLLVRLDQPFLLDFRRNRAFDVDWPGGASLPPGMPIHAGARALARYLRSHEIRYVAYSYGNEGGYPRAAFGRRLRGDPRSFPRVTARQAFAFQDELSELSRRYRHVYDDGVAEVLDLASRVPARDVAP